MHVSPDAEQRLHEDIDVLLVRLDPIKVAEQGLVTGVDLEHRQDVELVALQLHQLVLVREIDDRRVRLTGDQRRNPVRRAGHVGALAEFDVELVLNDICDRICPAATGMQHDRLTIQILKLAIFLRGHREEFQLRELEDDADRGPRTLHGGIGRSEADIHLAAENGLNCEFLIGERGPLVVETVCLRPVESDEECRKLIRRRFGKGNADLVRLGRRDRHHGDERNGEAERDRRFENSIHCFLPLFTFGPLVTFGRGSRGWGFSPLCRKQTF